MTTRYESVQISFDSCYDNPTLMCPRCSEGCLHQGKVTIYSREEDAPMTRVTVVEGDLVESDVMPSKQTRNPSSRRQGMSIEFECESCGADEQGNYWPLELLIEQHKGATFVSWRFEQP